MAFRINGIDITNVTINNNPINRLAVNGSIVWESGAPVEINYLITEDGYYLVTENNEKLEV